MSDATATIEAVIVTLLAAAAIGYGVFAMMAQDQPGWAMRALGGIVLYVVIWSYGLMRTARAKAA